MNKAWRKPAALLWLAVIIFTAFFSFRNLTKDGRIQFDLLALLPQGNTEKMLLSKKFMEDGNLYGRIVIAFGHENEELSKRAYRLFRDHMIRLELPILEQDAKRIEADYKTLFTQLYPYRAGLMAKEDRQLLVEGRSDQLAHTALAAIFSPFSLYTAAQIAKDPFGFYPRFVSSFLPDNSFQVDADAGMSIKSAGKFWHLYQGEITEKVFSLQLQEKISGTLQPILQQIEKEESVEVLRFGAAFYASAGAQLAQSEISKIGFISTFGIIVLLLLIFRGPRPILLALTVVSAGLLCGLAACQYFFGSIHILALVFGCSLVGVAVDYALHYYCASFRSRARITLSFRRRQSPGVERSKATQYYNMGSLSIVQPRELSRRLKDKFILARLLKPVDRFKIFSLLFPAMPLGVLTSAIGYGTLGLAPFPGIQQMAILACVGLVGSFISVGLWGPYFIPTGTRKTPPLAEKCQCYLEKFSHLSSVKHLKPILFAVLLSIACIGLLRVTFDDNVRRFQSPDPVLKIQEERIKNLLNITPSPLFLAVNEDSIESVLQTQEEITDELTSLGINYKALSDLIPSQKRQRENSQLKLEFCQSRFPEIAGAFGIETPFSPYDAGFDPEKLLAPDDAFIISLPTGWRELIDISEAGLITGRILLNSPLEPDKMTTPLKAIYVDPVHEYSLLFSSYRQAMLLVVSGLLLGFVLMIGCNQGMRAAFTITAPVLLSILTTIGIIGLFGLGFSMFHAMGLVLVLCIGIDYALFLYWREPDDKDLLLLGNALAATTTLLSFGLLTLSTTTSVQSFGMTVFMGIVLNFFVTTLYLGSSRCKNY